MSEGGGPGPISGLKKPRLTFEDFYDKALVTVLAGIGAYVAWQAKSINANIGELNSKMAAIVEKIANQEKRIDSVEIRLHEVETVR